VHTPDINAMPGYRPDIVAVGAYRTNLAVPMLRDGEVVGSHVLQFRDDGLGSIDVDVATDIAVSVMFVTVYRFEQIVHEHWVDGGLFDLTSRTRDDGEDHTLVATAEASAIRIADNGVAAQRPTGLIPSSLWNDAIVAGPQANLLSMRDGSALSVDVAYRGEETVGGVEGPVTARHYLLTGDLTREVWYDPDGVLVKVRFSGQDGADIEFVLR